MTLIDNWSDSRVPQVLRVEVAAKMKQQQRDLESTDFPLAALWIENAWIIMFGVNATAELVARRSIEDLHFLIMHFGKKAAPESNLTERVEKRVG